VIESRGNTNRMETFMNWGSRFVALALLSGLAVGAAGSAHTDECSIEDWRSRHSAGRTLWIEGATTCEKGRIRIRAYDNSDDASVFIGIAEGVVEGYIFEAYISDISEKPKSVEIKYSIEVQ